MGPQTNKFLDAIIVLNLLRQSRMLDAPTIGCKHGRLDHEVYNMIEGFKDAYKIWVLWTFIWKLLENMLFWELEHVFF